MQRYNIVIIYVTRYSAGERVHAAVQIVRSGKCRAHRGRSRKTAESLNLIITVCPARFWNATIIIIVVVNFRGGGIMLPMRVPRVFGERAAESGQNYTGTRISRGIFPIVQMNFFPITRIRFRTLTDSSFTK